MEKATSENGFLATYGWTLLIIVLILAVLFALGIFDLGNLISAQ